MEIHFLIYFREGRLFIVGECKNGTDSEKRTVMDKIIHYVDGRKLVCVYVFSDVDSDVASIC